MSGTTPPEVPFIRALTVFDDGTGPALYAGGEFHDAGGTPANSVARWDGTAFTPLGSGLPGTLPWVYSMTTFDDGSGPALWAGGVFDTAGVHSSRAVARWQCAPCYPNCDGSTTAPVLNVADFSCFLNQFAAGCP